MTTSARSQYISNVKKGIAIYKALEALEDNGKLWIKYDNKVYEIDALVYTHGRSYSIGDGEIFGRRMNVDMEKSNKTALYVYTYDLFNSKSTNRIHFQYVTITTKPEETK